jgi:SAM-dependent methyltransferase
MPEVNDVESCVCCASPTFEVLDLGQQPLANNLVDSFSDHYSEHPLKLMGCQTCAHLQLSCFVDPTVLFKHYLYSSGTSTTLRLYFGWLAMAISKALTNSSKSVLEIASNDGSFLDALKVHNIDAIGLDPAENLNRIARQKGHTVVDGFWPEESSLLERKFDCIVAQNVFAHNPDPLRFLIAAKSSLNKDGVLLVQTSQAEMLSNGQFDTIYHEHYSFFSPRSLVEIATRAGLNLNNVMITSIHGGSLLSIMSTTDRDYQDYFNGDWVSKRIEPELYLDLPRFLSLTESFKAKAESTRNRTVSVISRYRSSGHLVVFVGAAAKAVVFLNYANMKPDLVIDESKLKIGKIIPKINIEISGFEVVKEIQQPILFVISAWNFAVEIKRKLKKIRPKREDKFLNYFPIFEIS